MISFQEERIQQVFQEVLNDPNLIVTDDLRSQDIQSWDSFAHVKLAIAFEEEFNIEFSFSEVATISSVAELKKVLRSKGVDFT